MAARRVERRASGVCVICGSYPAWNGGVNCRKCTIYKREHGLDYYKRKKAAARKKERGK